MTNWEQKLLAKILSIDVKTLKSRLKVLQKNNWIGFSKRSGYYFIRGFAFVCKSLNIASNKVVVTRIEDLFKFKSFCGAVLFLKYYHIIKHREVKRKRIEQFQTSSNQIQVPKYLPIAHSYIHKRESIPISTVHSYKKAALQEKYISLYRTFKKDLLTKNISKQKYREVTGKHPFQYKNETYYLEPDRIYVDLISKSSRNYRRNV